MVKELGSYTLPRMRRDNEEVAAAMADDNGTYFTYRPLSNLPTPPPTYKESKSPSTIASSSLEDGEPLKAKYRGMYIAGHIDPAALSSRVTHGLM